MPKQTTAEKVVIIREAECIGCTKCIPVCPTNAIVGASKQRHVVIAPLCIGCGLCIDPCPTDCIDWQLLPALSSDGRRHKAQLAKHQIQRRQQRQRVLADLKAAKDKAATAQIQEKLNALLNHLPLKPL